MNRTAPEAAVVVVASVSGERIETVQDIRNAMFNEGGSNLSNSDDAKSTILELFPWISEFKKMCKCIYVDKTMASLAELMQYYIRNVSVSVSDCYTKPLRAAKLKDSISETLPLFLYIYRELSENCNRSIYLNNMSDLLAMYIDMELKASKRSKEDHSTICTRLTSYLYVYLEHSTEHLLDTLIKMQLMCRGYYRILDPIITKIINNIPAHPDSNVMYVRYLLIYCLWRKVNSDMAVKSQITTTAIASLGAPPAAFPPCVLGDVLPKVPKCQPNSAKYLMQQKFDIRKCCELFIQFCRESRGGTWPEKSENAIVIPSSSKKTTSHLLGVISRENKTANCTENNFSLAPSGKDTQNNSVSSDVAEQTSVKPLGTISTNISRTISKPIKPKLLSRKKAKKSNKIVVIDLTTDIVLEKCIKKRKSRKVAWLEEAKKLDAKAIRASQKMKKQQMAENVNTLKKITLDHQLEDLLQPVRATENARSKSDRSASAARDTKLDNDKVKSRQNSEAERRNAVNGNTVFAKQPADANSSDKRIVQVPCAVSSVIVDRPQSNKSKAAASSLLDVPKDANNASKRHDAASAASNTEKTINRHNARTVIKRLIEKDTPHSESEACKRAESLRKICDLGTEHSKTVNTPAAIRALGDSKDGDDSCNRNANYLSTTKDKLSPHVVSSLVHVHHGSDDEQRETVNGTIGNIHDNDKCTQEDTQRKTINNGAPFSESTRTDGDLSKGDFAVSTTTAETRTTAAASNAVLINDATGPEQLRRSYITTEHTKQPKESESQDEYVSARHDIANNTVSLSIMSGDHSNVQTDLEVGTCIEIGDNVRDSEISNCKIRETIFENHTDRADKTSISSVLDILCSKEEGVSSDKDINSARTARKKDAQHPDGFNAEEECNVREELARSSVLRAQVEKNLRDLDHEQGQHENFKPSKESQTCKISHAKDLEDLSGDKCIIQNSDLQDNIDGLALLADVSQRYSHHVPPVKPNELKCEQIKVKDYASLRNSPCNQTTDDDEADTNDSSNTASQFLENPTTEVINRIVGIYPEDALDKVALHVEVTSTTDVTPDSRENNPSNNVPHIVETINYEADALSSNLSMVENNVQSIKENTNVILNGETVVLLQKAPNLYIINKAVENARDHNSDDESCSVKEKNWIPPEDCASFEVVNMSEHISFNLDVPQYSKELSCQENKFSVGRSKGIKVEPEEEGGLMNVAEMKSYGKKGSLSVDALPAASQIYQDTSVANVNTSKSTDKRKSILTYRQNIKQEFNNHITQNCANCVQGSNGIHSRDVIDPQHSLHIPVTHPTTISSIYGNCAASTDLYMPYRKHCAVSCSFEINSTTSLHSHTKSANSYGSSHCSCVNCTYMFAHYRQCMHPTTDSHSCIESNSYFLPAHTSVQTSTVQEHDRAKSEAAINKLYDDQLLSKIEQQILQNNTLDEQCEQNKFFKKDIDNKLPLKKRLKMRLKKEKLDSYPSVPMMSIADIEMLDGTQKHPSQVIKSSYELSPNEGNSPHDNYFSSNIAVRQNRKDYYKDMRIPNLHQNLPKESARNNERQFRPSNDQPAVCLDTCQNRVFKTPAQRRDVTITSPTSVKRITPEPMEQDSVCKKAKKSQSSRQTRSSKRNVPKVNYCYTDVDPEWNPSGESKRRRKKTSR
ncbi:hypothetical protein DMN91_009399 [Ooceraea biroi]|uniref:Uncharacterized protein n=1 Tax=Ooceraea biroi TaxID=2015173 RepID=A0A3L8DFH3_OOCBI|nr:uncharacterized protein LOC105279008 isoform X2 [Ooceraea biroi]RLU19041.1 hypothetical protein DMN91_009399 [Ooceraea biroi]